MKVLDFTKPPPKPEHQPHLPDGEVLRDLLINKPMKACVAIVINEDGLLSFWIDGMNIFEAVGVMESAKLAMLDQTDYEEYDLD